MVYHKNVGKISSSLHYKQRNCVIKHYDVTHEAVLTRFSPQTLRAFASQHGPYQTFYWQCSEHICACNSWTLLLLLLLFILFGSTAQRGLWPPRFTRFFDYTRRPTVGSLWTSDQLVAETWQHTTNIHAPGEIRTHYRSTQAAMTYALDRAATETGNSWTYLIKFKGVSC
jgi:hypothetical protein